MGNGYAVLANQAKTSFDQGHLEEATQKYLKLSNLQLTSDVSSTESLQLSQLQSNARMNLALLAMCRGQYWEADRLFRLAMRYEVQYDGNRVQTHSNALAIYYRTVLYMIEQGREQVTLPCPNPWHQGALTVCLELKRFLSKEWVKQALQAHPELLVQVACVEAWMSNLIPNQRDEALNMLDRTEKQLKLIKIHSEAEPSHYQVDSPLESMKMEEMEEMEDVLEFPQQVIHNQSDGAMLTSGEWDASPYQWMEKDEQPYKSLSDTQEKVYGADGQIELMKAIVSYSMNEANHQDFTWYQAHAQAARAIHLQQSELKSISTTSISSLSDDALLWMIRGDQFVNSAQWQASFVCYTLALTCQWIHPPSWLLLARISTILHYDHLSHLLLRILTLLLVPQSPQAWMVRGFYSLFHHAFNEAAICFDKIILDLDPDSALAWERRAYATLQMRKWHSTALTQGWKMCQRALTLDPHLPLIHLTLAQILFELRLYDLAIEEFALVKRYYPNDVETLHGYATTLRSLGLCSQAIVYYNLALNQRSIHAADITYHLSICYYQLYQQQQRKIRQQQRKQRWLKKGDAPPPLVPLQTSRLNSSSSNNPRKEDSIKPSSSVDDTIDPSSANQSSSPQVSQILHEKSHQSLELGLEATERALENLTILKSSIEHHDVPLDDFSPDIQSIKLLSEYDWWSSKGQQLLHHYYPPSPFPCHQSFRDTDEPEFYIRSLQVQYLKSQILGIRSKFLACLGRSTEAMTTSERSISLNVFYPSHAWFNHAQVCQILRIPIEKTINSCKKVIDLDIHYEEGYHLLISSLIRNKSCDEALEWSEKLLVLQEENPLQDLNTAIFFHCRLLSRMYKYSELCEFCQNQLELIDLKSSGPLTGNSHSLGNEYREEFLKWIEERQRNSILVNRIHLAQRQKPALLYYASLGSMHCNDLDMALGYINQAIELDQRSRILEQKGRVYLLKRRFDEALDYFERAIALDPTRIQSPCYRGICLCQLNRTQEGCLVLKKTEKEDIREFEKWMFHLSSMERKWYHEIVIQNAIALDGDKN